MTFEQPPYRIRECERCGLLYRDCTLSAEEFARYYSLVPAQKWAIAGYYPTEAAILARLKALPPRRRILDFGCSSGRLLSSLTATHECHGIEINEEAAHAAAKKGLHMLGLEDLVAKAAWFDAIILADVFEHLSAPVALLRQLVSALKPTGALMIVTGNGDAPACRRDPAQFWYFREIEHICMFTRRHADFLAGELNLEMHEWTELCHYDLSLREKLVQQLQNFAYWQFREQTALARGFLNFLPLFSRLRQGDVAPTYSCSPDHVLAVFRKR
ncbi:MAG TPA: class I SAM-dependent methyltransferase [Chthoniobacterales bacterium]|nr:class I SAM-dependent methyltransferase [Chthoniobacterales bacterium]